MQEVHETIGRSLGALLLHLDRADKATPGGSPSIAHIDSARVLAHEALFDARRTVLGLAPSGLAGRTLEEAVRQELDTARAGSPVDLRFLVTGERHDLAPVVAYQLFMVIQEAVANVLSHSGSTACRVGIFYDEAGVRVVIEDNGCGFERRNIERDIGSAQGIQLGLHGIASRIHYLRGELHVDSTLGWGTSIRAQVPYSSNGDASRERWKVLVACTRPLVRAGLVRLLEASEPSVQVLGEAATLEDLTEAVSLLQPDMLILDEPLLGPYTQARPGSGETVERPVVVVADQPTDEQLALSASSGVRGFIALSATSAEVARVVVAAARGDALLDGAVFSRLAECRDSSDDAASRLTARERQVRNLLAEGLADKQIATRLGISVKTVEKHVGAMLRKTGARNRTMLVTRR